MSSNNQQESSNNSSNPQSSQATDKRTSSFFSTLKSVLGAMFGVQSDSQLEKDFNRTDPVALILGGIAFVVVFIFAAIWLVNIAMENAGQ